MQTLRGKRIVLAGVVGLMVLPLVACGGQQAETGGTGSVKVRTDVYFTGANLALVAGVHKGIFSKHGLQVTLNPGTGSATTIQTVANGSDDIGYADAGTLVQSRGKGIKVKMVSGMVQKNPMALLAFADSGITGPKDLEGKTAGFTPGSAAERLFPAYASATGIDEKKITFQNVDVPTRGQLFLARKTQFTFGLINTTLPTVRASCKCDPVVLAYSDVGINVLSSGIVAGDDFLKSRPDDMRKFLAGLQESIEWTNANPEEAVKEFNAQAPDNKLTAQVLTEQWKESERLSRTPASTGQPAGCTVTKDWEATIQAMEQYGDLAKGKVKPADVGSNRYLPAKCGELTS